MLALLVLLPAGAYGRSIERRGVADISVYAERYGIPLRLAKALVGQESGGNASAVSPKGATGLTQVMPETAAGMYHITPEKARVLLMNPDFALDAGMKYLSMQKQAFGTWSLALAAYNAGPNAVRRYNGIPPYAETQSYVRNIMSAAGAMSAEPLSWEDESPPAASVPSVVTAPAVPRTSPADSVMSDGIAELAAGNYSPTRRLQAILGITPRPLHGGTR